MSVNVDDNDVDVLYSGSWGIDPSPQAHGGSVHSTTQNGASATITFTGTRIIMYCTLPTGNGNEIVDINLDGHTSSLTRHSLTASASYQVEWFDSGPLSNSEHVLVVSNGGGGSDSPFQLDYFSVQGTPLLPGSAPPPPPPPPPAAPVTTSPPPAQQVTTTNSPSAAPAITSGSAISAGSVFRSLSGSSSSFGPSSASSASLPRSETAGNLVNFATTTGATVTALQYVTTTGADGSVITYVANPPASTLYDSSPKVSIEAIVGATIGGLLLILLLLFLFLRRRRNKMRHMALANESESDSSPRTLNMGTVIPFRLDAHQSQSSASRSETPFSDGSEFAQKYSPASPALRVRNADDKNGEFLNAASASIAPQRVPEVDAGPYVPQYLSDVPPSYQSVRDNY